MLMPVDILGKIKGNIVCLKDDVRTEYVSCEDFENGCGQYDDVVSISAEDSKVVIEIVNREEEIKRHREAFLKQWEEEHGPWFSPYGY